MLSRVEEAFSFDDKRIGGMEVWGREASDADRTGKISGHPRGVTATCRLSKCHIYYRNKI